MWHYSAVRGPPGDDWSGQTASEYLATFTRKNEHLAKFFKDLMIIVSYHTFYHKILSRF